MVNYIYINKRECILNQKSITLETDWPQYDHPTTSITTQKYSSTTFISSRFQSHTEKFGAYVKIVTISVFLGHQRLRKSKLRTLKLLMSGSVCIFQKWLPSICKHHNTIST
jgi:hypothetical protein